MLKHRITHDFVVRAVLHATGIHRRIVKINLRHHAWSPFVLEDQHLGLKRITVNRSSHIFRNTGFKTSLLDIDAVPHVI